MAAKFFNAAIIAALLIVSSYGVPVKKEATLADEQIRVISEVLFDYTTHVLQTAKAARAMGDGIMPFFSIGRVWALDYTKQVCSANNTDCEDVHEQLRMGGLSSDDLPTTYIYGITGNTANITFGLNNFTYTYYVENLALMSADYQRITTTLSSGVQHIYSGLELTVGFSTVGLSGDFEFADGVFQVSNVKVLLDLGGVSMAVPEVTKFENGTWTELEPIEKQAAPKVMELWKSTDENAVTLEERYSSFVEEKVNDFLAGRLII